MWSKSYCPSQDFKNVKGFGCGHHVITLKIIYLQSKPEKRWGLCAPGADRTACGFRKKMWSNRRIHVGVFSLLNLKKKTWTCLICRKSGVLIYSDLSSLMSLRYKHLQMITIPIMMLQHRVMRTFLWWKSGSRFFPFLGFTGKCLVSSIMAPPSFLPGKYPQS